MAVTKNRLVTSLRNDLDIVQNFLGGKEERYNDFPRCSQALLLIKDSFRQSSLNQLAQVVKALWVLQCEVLKIKRRRHSIFCKNINNC